MLRRLVFSSFVAMATPAFAGTPTPEQFDAIVAASQQQLAEATARETQARASVIILQRKLDAMTKEIESLKKAGKK